LKANSDKAVYVFLNGDENLASHVAAFLGPRCLVFYVDTSGSLLNEEFGKLHSGSETTVAGIGVSNYGSHIINDGSRGKFRIGEVGASFSLLPIVEKLGNEQVLNLVRDGIVGVVYCKNQINGFGTERPR
jgi:hypothetical protein